MKVIADKNIPFLKGVLEPFADMIYLPGDEISNDHIKDADALLIRTRTKCNEELLKKSKISFIGTATIGSDHIDKDYCEKSGIKWVAAEGCNSNAVLQYITSALCHLSVRYNFDLKDKTLGVVGVGNIGKKVVRLAEEIGMRVLLNDPPRERNEGKCGFHSLKVLKQECDIITFHVPLNHEGEDKTFHLCDENFLSGTIKDTIIINSSRGGVIDEKALIRFIENRHLLACVLDVYEKEPMIDHHLLHHLTFATSHIAGYSLDGKANGTTAVVNKLSKHFNLPYTSWEANIGESENLSVNIDYPGKSFQEILTDIVRQIYPITEDDKKLRNNPENFEELRNSYTYRRDFNAWKVSLIKGTEDIERKLRRLGFRVES